MPEAHAGEVDRLWHVPGDSAIAADYHGVDAVLDYFARRRDIAQRTFRMHPGGILIGDEHVAVLTDGTATISGVEHRWSRQRPLRVSSALSISLIQVSDDERLLGDVRDPDGALVVLLARIWDDKIVVDHPELRDLREQVLEVTRAPDHVEGDPQADRRRYYRRSVGPSRWLMVVVSFEQEPARIITALALRKDPRRWKP